MSSSQKGNALFLILIAVALFAALSYAITQSGKGGGGGASKEKAALDAAQIASLGTAVQQGVLRLTLTGTPVTSITVGTGGTNVGLGTDNGYENLCTSGASCLFAADGGGVSVPKPPRSAFTDCSFCPSWNLNNYFTGVTSFQGVQVEGFAGTSGHAVGGFGTAANDDVILFYPLTQAVCQSLNTGLGITGIPISMTGNPITSAATDGKESACVDWENSGGTNYVYYHVINAR